MMPPPSLTESLGIHKLLGGGGGGRLLASHDSVLVLVHFTRQSYVAVCWVLMLLNLPLLTLDGVLKAIRLKSNQVHALPLWGYILTILW